MRQQFGSFDGRDNRRTILDCFWRLGHGLPEREAGLVRARFLGTLLPLSDNGFAGKTAEVEPCSAKDAYFLFVAVTGVLGVPIEDAATLLEGLVRAV